MNQTTAPTHVIRFGVFEADLRAGELRRNGSRVKLQEQPFQLLVMLLEHPGKVVTREEIQQKLWPSDTFVDFEHSINAAVKRLREALGDDADNPRFVETLHRRGYRFIAPVVGADAVRPDVGAGLVPAPEGRPRGAPVRKRWEAIAAAGIALIAIALAVGLNVAGLRDRVLTAVGAQGLVPLPRIQSIAVLPLENLSRAPSRNTSPTA